MLVKQNRNDDPIFLLIGSIFLKSLLSFNAIVYVTNVIISKISFERFAKKKKKV